MDKQNLPHIASRVLNTPLLLEPGYAATFFSALSKRLGIVQLIDATGQVDTEQRLRESAEAFGGSTPARSRPYVVRDGVAILPIDGTLVHKFGYMQPYSGMTGYDGIIARHKAACADPEVRGILLDFDTPGGEVSGCFDAARQLRAQAEASGKPTWSLGYDMYCSGGMALASAASRRLITQTSYAGSVGVLMAHASFESQLEKEGIVVTLIHAGARKVDGNPYENLPEDVLARFQASTDTLRRDFATLVSDHIGMSVDAILATEADVFRGKAAIEIGFADELVNGNEAVAMFAEHLRSGRTSTTVGGTTTMTTTAQSGSAPGTQEQAGQNDPAAIAAAEKRGAEAAHQRYSQIMAMSKPGIEQFVQGLANDPSVSVADAKIKIGDKYLEMQTDKFEASRASRNESVSEEHAGTRAQGTTQDRWEKNEGGVQGEFTSLASFQAYEQAKAKGLVKILGGKV